MKWGMAQKSHRRNGSFTNINGFGGPPLNKYRSFTFVRVVSVTLLLSVAVLVYFHTDSVVPNSPVPEAQVSEAVLIDSDGDADLSPLREVDERVRVDDEFSVHNASRTRGRHKRQQTTYGVVAKFSANYESQAICSRHWARGIEKLVDQQLLKSWRVFFSMNLHQNAAVTPHLLTELHRVLTWLDATKAYVSVYESGSTDNTPSVLSVMHSLLVHMRVPHNIIANATDVRGDGMPRIEFLARVRNRALQPLFDMQDEVRFDKVFFNNDVYFCAEDVLLLLLHDAHIAAGFDINNVDWDSKKIRFYDNWVGRDLNGDDIGYFHPFVRLPESQKRIEQALPVPVYCAWNGMVSIAPEVFYDQQILFRTRAWRGECSSSEMTLFCQDIWNVYRERTRVIIDPRVLVAYSYEVFADIDLARQKRVPAAKGPNSYDVGVFPNPWRDYFQPRPAYLKHVLKTLNVIPYPTEVPSLIKCCPLPDGATYCVGNSQCHWEPVLSGKMLAQDPNPANDSTCPPLPDREKGKEMVFVAVTLIASLPVPPTFYHQMELLGQYLGSNLFVSIVARGEEEWPPWRSQLANIFWSMNTVKLKHYWVGKRNVPAFADPGSTHEAGVIHWQVLQHQKGRITAFLVDPHQEFCAVDLIAEIDLFKNDRVACTAELFTERRSTSCNKGLDTLADYMAKAKTFKFKRPV
eukprot:jgi/Chlat1/6823/Chrsp51S06513